MYSDIDLSDGCGWMKETGKATDRRPDPTAAWRQETRKGDSSSATNGRARQLLGGRRRYGQYKVTMEIGGGYLSINKGE